MVWHASLKYLLEWLVAAQLVDKYGEVDPVFSIKAREPAVTHLSSIKSSSEGAEPRLPFAVTDMLQQVTRWRRGKKKKNEKKAVPIRSPRSNN